jgi:hypothetical protein
MIQNLVLMALLSILSLVACSTQTKVVGKVWMTQTRQLDGESEKVTYFDLTTLSHGCLSKRQIEQQDEKRQELVFSWMCDAQWVTVDARVEIDLREINSVLEMLWSKRIQCSSVLPCDQWSQINYDDLQEITFGDELINFIFMNHDFVEANPAHEVFRLTYNRKRAIFEGSFERF